MSYRGDDLDLRTPQSRASRESYAGEPAVNGARGRPGSAANRNDALFVDDTVLACCNHAYDVALAHGASEVRLEHLVHALTRVEAAAEILEQRGIREAHLRRESAAVIASEIPVGLGHTSAAPRSSVEFEDVLRRASDQARARGSAATVHDLLWVLLNYARDYPAISLLLRHASNWQQWDWPQDIRRETAPARAVAYSEPRRTAYVETPQPQSRSRAVEQVALPPQVVYAQAQPDEGLYARFDQMESTLRKLQSDMATERRAFVDLIRELQRDIAASRNTQPPAMLIDRLQGVETAIEKRLDESGRVTSQLTERLQSLERSVSAGMQDGAKNWAALSERFKVVDKLAASNSNAGISDIITEQFVQVTDYLRATSDKIQTIERTLDTRQAESQRAWSGVAERLRGIDETVAGQRQQLAEVRTSFTTDIRGMIERALSGQAQATGVIQSLISDRFNAINQQFDQQGLELTSAVSQLAEPTLARLTQVDTANQQRQREQTDMLRFLAERTDSLETLVKTTAEQSNTAARADKSELHEAVVKLAANQQTLADNLEQWRAEAEGGLSIVSNRLELLERGSAAPLQALKQMQVDLAALQQVTLADYDQNRKGIRNWLFGTEDLFSGSWRDETAQIRARLKQFREERKV